MEKTYLDIPPAHVAYAMRFGAQLDPATNKYFVIGEAPGELYSYVCQKPRVRQYANEVPEQCPRCGSVMDLRKNSSDGSLYYRCSSRSGCRGTKPEWT